MLQQVPDLGGLSGLVRDPVLGDDGLLLVQHGGEQPRPGRQHAAQPLAVDRDRPQQPVQAPGVRQVAEPAAEDLVQDLGVDEVEQRPDPGLAQGDDLPPQRVRLPAEVAQHVLGQVSGMVADLPEGLRPGQRARGGDREDEHQAIAAAPGLPRVRDCGQHRQQAGSLPCPVLDHAGHGGNSGMRHCTGGLSFRSDKDSTPVIKPGGRPLPRITRTAAASAPAQLAGTHPAVKSGTCILVAALGYITPTRRSRGDQVFHRRRPVPAEHAGQQRDRQRRKRRRVTPASSPQDPISATATAISTHRQSAEHPYSHSRRSVWL